MPASVLYMSMSLDGYIAGPNDKRGNPGGDGFGGRYEWYGDPQPSGAGASTGVRGTGLRNVRLRPRRHELCVGGSVTSRRATTVAMSSRRPGRQ